MILQLANTEHSAVGVKPAQTPLHSQAGHSPEPPTTTTTGKLQVGVACLLSHPRNFFYCDV